MMRSISLVFLSVCITLCWAAQFSRSGISSEVNRETVAELKAYWTRDRLKAATPRDVLYRDGEPITNELTPADFDLLETRTPVSEPGKDSIFFPSDREDSVNTEPIASKRYAGAYASTYTGFPWRTVGKVFFTMNGADYVCSGAVLRNYLVATAGHCVYDAINGAGWATKWTFIPGYNSGNKPYGEFQYYQLWSSSEWVNSASFCKDYGFAVMQKLNGYGVGDYVGYLGWLYNGGYSQTWRALGYPQASPFDGTRNYYVTSQVQGTDASCGGRCAASGCAPATMKISSDATGGASGGPWIVESTFGSVDHLNSVNSYKYNNDPNSMYGPYFDDTWFSVYSSAVAVTPP